MRTPRFYIEDAGFDKQHFVHDSADEFEACGVWPNKDLAEKVGAMLKRFRFEPTTNASHVFVRDLKERMPSLQFNSDAFALSWCALLNAAERNDPNGWRVRAPERRQHKCFTCDAPTTEGFACAAHQVDPTPDYGAMTDEEVGREFYGRHLSMVFSSAGPMRVRFAARFYGIPTQYADTPHDAMRAALKGASNG